MNQTERTNTGECVLGFAWPQIGFFIDHIIDCQIGFSSSYGDSSKVKLWIKTYKDALVKFYGTDILTIVEKSLAELYEIDPEEDVAFENKIEELLSVVMPMAADYESTNYIP